jgi:hypothetical protein
MQKQINLMHYVFKNRKINFGSAPVGSQTKVFGDLNLSVEIKAYSSGVSITYEGNFLVQEVLSFEPKSAFYSCKTPYDHLEIHSIDNFNASFNGSVINEDRIKEFIAGLDVDDSILLHEYDNGDYIKSFYKYNKDEVRIILLCYDSEYKCAVFTNTVIS